MSILTLEGIVDHGQIRLPPHVRLPEKDSPSGSCFVERILTVVTTLRMQGRNVLDYVASACEAALQGRDAPSLLPG
jgi:hypothetical protein